ncbi:MAG: YpmA family protein [Syntrophomonadaceae bacterium]|nr:YpmA family protein [Syntrophomonadaceae bacterium]
MDDQQGKLVLIAHKSFKADPELVYIVDFLNKTLKDKHIMFGLTKDRDKEEMTINIYEF